MKNKWKIVLIVLIALGVIYFFAKPRSADKKAQIVKEVSPRYGSIQKTIVATAVVQPQNRLEMKPPIAGRIDSILVKEGQQVKAGDVVALMSSTERAALLDAARSKDEKEQKYWQEIYKPIPLIAPIEGTVIVSVMQPGQTVTQTEAVVVLSNKLIVQAQVDETDIGKVKEGQAVSITLDAYPSVRVDATVTHIYYESTVVNNVTIYKVDLLPSEIPEVFRSGMSANARIVEESKDNVLLLPNEAIKRSKTGDWVHVSPGKKKTPVKREIKTGISDENNTEILSGLTESDTVVIMTQKFAASKTQGQAGNPFLPQGGGRRRT